MGLSNIGNIRLQAAARPNLAYGRLLPVCCLWSKSVISEKERTDPSQWRCIKDVQQDVEACPGVGGGISSLLTWISQVFLRRHAQSEWEGGNRTCLWHQLHDKACLNSVEMYSAFQTGPLTYLQPAMLSQAQSSYTFSTLLQINTQTL